MKAYPILFFLLLLFPVCSYAKTDLRTDYEYYDISGKNEKELRRQMNQKGPQADGKPYDAYTKWDIRWKYTYHQNFNRCAISSVKTSADILFTLPRWVDSANGSAELKNKWNHFIETLKTHEEGHKSIAVRAAAEIDEFIGRIPPSPSCDQLGYTANARGAQIIDTYRAEEIEYDRTTKHGKKQGVRFP